MPGTCPSTEQLAVALRGRPSSAEDAELAAHLAECPACQARLEELAGGSGWLKDRVKAHEASKNPASESLHKAMRALESGSSSPEIETTTPVNLDFLQPTDQHGVLGLFGHYEVLKQVAAGGMGIVLKARDPGLNRVVALKILPPVLAANSLARARFIREARAAAAVVHEHVVPIYAVDEFAGLPYLVMQFIEGRTLSERLRVTGPLRLEEILRIGAQTAAGLAAAHAQGLIHRDVKPGNILLENGVERVKITDFGLARTTDDSSLTRDGYIAGTPEYMSPEQARNEPVDQRADLFSLGCVLYEMATGVSPFHAEKPLVAMRRVCDEEPPAAHTLNPKIPEWLGQLIHRLMVKTAAARPQTAAEVAAELGRRLAESQQALNPNRVLSGPASSSAKRARWIPQLAWASMILLPLVLAVLLIYRPQPESPDVDKSPVVPVVTQDALFAIPASSNSPERGFATLADAVAAANDGSVIECRFDGLQSVSAIRRNEKALVIRAGGGFEPVLSPAADGELLLFTHAPLILEGLTIRTAHVLVPGNRRLPRASAGVIIEDAPFLAAHCRFEISTASTPTRPPPHIVQLFSVSSARLLNCEIASGTAFGLSWNWRRETPGPELDRELLVQGCMVEGNLVTTILRGPGVTRLVIHQSTFGGIALLWPMEALTADSLEVQVSRNVLVAETLIKPVSAAKDSALLELLRWHGTSNVYSVESYAQTSPPFNRHDEWLASAEVRETNSFAIELGLKSRLASLTERSRAAVATAFTLTPDELKLLAAQGWTSPEPPGANPQKTGPGQPYHEWRNSPDYAEWLKLVRAHVAQSVPNR